MASESTPRHLIIGTHTHSGHPGHTGLQSSRTSDKSRTEERRPRRTQGLLVPVFPPAFLPQQLCTHSSWCHHLPTTCQAVHWHFLNQSACCPTQWALLSSSYRWENWGLEKFSDLPRSTGKKGWSVNLDEQAPRPRPTPKMLPPRSAYFLPDTVTYVCVCVCVCASALTQSCLTLCKTMDCSPPSSSVHRTLQARILE